MGRAGPYLDVKGARGWGRRARWLPAPAQETAPRRGSHLPAPAAGKKQCFVLSVLRSGSRQNSASCDLLGNFPASYSKVPQKTHTQEAGGASPPQPVSWGARPRGVRGTEARSQDDPRGPRRGWWCDRGSPSLHAQPTHSLRGHPLRPDVPSAPDHVPAAGPPLSRAFPKLQAASRPQGRWVQESWGAGGQGAGGAQWPAEPSHGGRSDTAAESRGLSAARRREHNGPVVLCFLPSPPVIGRPRLLARHHCGNRGLMALPGWPSLSLFCASLWWRQYGTPSFSPSGQSV